MKTQYILLTAGAGAAICITIAFAISNVSQTEQPVAKAASQPVLTVSVIRPETKEISRGVPANGNIMPWQEASIGAEAQGLRLIEVHVNVGDSVKRGQLLARFSSDTTEASLERSRAAVKEADAAFADSAANALRAKALQDSGALSGQQIQQLQNAERAALARLEAAQAQEKTERLRLTQTEVFAPDDGLISSRSATVGAVVPGGQELFRLIRGGRLEWRAEVASADMAKLRPDQVARIKLPGGSVVEGRLRTLGPVVELQSRNGIAYVDLPPKAVARAGMFARGEFVLGIEQAMTLPQSAVQTQNGSSHVMVVKVDSRIAQTKVTTRSWNGNGVEIVDGLKPEDRVVVAGTAFLGDGDLVRVVEPVTALKVSRRSAQTGAPTRQALR